MAWASCSVIGAAVCASAGGAAAAPRQRHNVSFRILRNMSNSFSDVCSRCLRPRSVCLGQLRNLPASVKFSLNEPEAFSLRREIAHCLGENMHYGLQKGPRGVGGPGNGRTKE